ncbi:hypothetical protein [Polaromonas sp. OV174]|uniref:hypothetical protein n=1 Tax=Polaromonas sp. OV174 TaxID=1855300 RepID=UPI001160565A|nr:hypothetical protein [Polaromonas sp. OV174]
MSAASVWRALGPLAFYAATAQVGSAQTFYQCLDAQGRPGFSAQACERGQAPQQDQPSLTEQLDRHIAQRQPQASGRPQVDLRTERMNSPSCQRARRAHDAAASATSPHHQELQARRSAMQGACGITPPELTIVR